MFRHNNYYKLYSNKAFVIHQYLVHHSLGFVSEGQGFVREIGLRGELNIIYLSINRPDNPETRSSRVGFV